MKSLYLSATIILSCLLPAHAETPKPARELSAPLVRMTPVIKQNADMLELTEAQRADLADWLSIMPAKRMALEAQAREARAALRQAVLDGAPEAELQPLADKVGALEVTLVMTRARCVNHWREVLSPEQFAQAVSLTRAH